MVAKGKNATTSAAEYLPSPAAGPVTLEVLREAAAVCRGCDLYKLGTQTVFGEGAREAELMFVGEQPGDQEDLAGRPFVGPAGRVFNEALAEAGIDRGRVYVTNAVKHFKWTPRGTRRMHAKPTVREIRACRPWLEAELAVVKPHLLVLLGATAAQSLLGAAFRITRDRGTVMETDWGRALATMHPSAVLRMPDEAAQARAYRDLVTDLKIASRAARSA